MIITDANIDYQDYNDGCVILINKPLGVSSFYVVDQIQKSYWLKRKQKLKIGHAGTLDPLATGLLILCTGKMTKKINLFQDMEKTYTGTFQLGASTASYDLETEVVNHLDTQSIDILQIELVRSSFMGFQNLRPPVYSAIKLNGKRAYELARKGLHTEMPLKPIYISRFNISLENFPELSFTISCTKGTYIRSIAHEFGKRLNNAAYLSSLQRTAIGDYQVQNAFELTDFLEKLNPVINVI
ncbi:MAG: tRNA pseudouridine(55) synthase TruB [Saprospiraceae bacterium]|nr:tRNA pseudouridine(55) synthase TruB [Saprospiraceae bacterium]